MVREIMRMNGADILKLAEIRSEEDRERLRLLA
jgi:hypothetical protein